VILLMTLEMPIRLGQGTRSLEEAVSFAISHRIRVEIRAILNEGIRTHEELAHLIGLPASRIGHHIKELTKDGSIEIAYVKPVRNTIQHYYRAVAMPFYSDEEIAAMPVEARQATAGVILQAVMAEALAAFWAGTMVHDRRVWLSWRWFNVDTQGRGDIADDQARSWARVQEIEAESAARCLSSGETTKSIIVTSLGFLRSRSVTQSGPSDGKTE
jgi:DNA-binding transcriptional ArsR family regulator